MNMKAIGVIRSMFARTENAPHQGVHSREVARLVIFPEHESLLEGIERFEKVMLIYGFNKIKPDPKPGALATRTPNRPNPIGVVVVELVERRGSVLLVRGVDALDASPIFDIKPFIREIDCPD